MGKGGGIGGFRGGKLEQLGGSGCGPCGWASAWWNPAAQSHQTMHTLRRCGSRAGAPQKMARWDGSTGVWSTGAWTHGSWAAKSQVPLPRATGHALRRWGSRVGAPQKMARRPCCCAAGRCRQSPRCARVGPRQSVGGRAAARGGSARCASRRRARQGCGAACAENKRAQASASWLSGSLSQYQIMPQAVPRASVSLGQSAAWYAYALAGPTGLAFDMATHRLPQSAVQHAA